MARQHALVLGAKIKRLKADPNGFFRGLFYGPPGTGKTELCNWLARELAGHELAIEKLNGQSLTIEVARGWRRHLCYRPLLGDWTVKFVDEVDRSSDAALC